MSDSKRLKLIINTYHPHAQKRIFGLIHEYFERAQMSEHACAVSTAIDEIIKNAIKANYKFVLVMNEIIKSRGEDVPSTSCIEYEKLAPEILESGLVSGRVRDILNEESRYIRIISAALAEGRGLNDCEREALSGLVNYNAVLRDIRSGRIVTSMLLERDGDYITIEVTNTSPLLKKDLDRIAEKVSEFRRCKREGREHDFFINNLDTSESGFGLGYALIDNAIASMGYDSEQIISISNAGSTSVKLAIPLGNNGDTMSAVEFVPIIF